MQRPNQRHDASGPNVAEASIRKVILFVSVVYIIEATGGPFGLLNLPMLRLAKDEAGLSPTAISAWLSFLALPWIAKPLFGAIADLIPCLARNRRMYVLVAGIVLLVCYANVACFSDLNLIAVMLFAASCALAAISTICGGVLVERGRRFGAIPRLVFHQRFWLYAALCLTPIGGGYLCAHLGIAEAVHAAAAILLIPTAVCLLLALRGWGQPNTAERSRLTPTLKPAFRYMLNSGFLLVLAFLLLHLLSPGFNLPLYFHLINTLHFDQATIGYLNSTGAAGSLAGALLFGYVLDRLRLSRVVYLSVLLNVLSGLSYLILQNNWAAYGIYFCGGMFGAISVIVTVTLTAEFCPPRIESLAFASLASMENFALHASNVLGSFLYDHVTQRHFEPLVVISVLCTALCALLIPFLHLDGERQSRLLERSAHETATAK